MPRDIMAERNVVEIYDGKCGETHEFYYRDPTVKEMEAYNAQCFTRKRNKVTNHQFATRLKFGKKVLEGFAKGTLAANGKLMASDPEDPDHMPGWKNELVKRAPDLVAKVAQTAFESAKSTTDEDEIVAPEEEDGEEDGENPPLASE